jgi:hypothetical protein
VGTRGSAQNNCDDKSRRAKGERDCGTLMQQCHLHSARRPSWSLLPTLTPATKIQITSRQSPTFGGYAFEGVGPYESQGVMQAGWVNPTIAK